MTRTPAPKSKHSRRGTKGKFAAAREVDWAEVRAAYEGDDLTVNEICARHGISANTINKRVNAEGWPKRRARMIKTDSRDRVARLMAALDRQVADIERRLAEAGEGGELEASARERDARTLATLARTLDNLNKMTPETETEDNDQPPEDIDAFREELARRLDELRRQGGD